MRFAAFATCLSIVAIAPMAIAIAGPDLDQASFLSAVRCAAYDAAPAIASRNFPVERLRLNAEARGHSPALVDQARAEIDAVAKLAANTTAADLRRARATACAVTSNV